MIRGPEHFYDRTAANRSGWKNENKQIGRVVSMFRAGMDTTEIATVLNTTESRVYNLLAKREAP